MRKVVLLGFLLLLAIDTSSNVLIKLAGNVIGEPSATLEWVGRVTREPLVLAVVGCYIAAFLTYTSLLKHAPVGPAYAAVHGHVVTVLIVSMLWFGERLTLVQALGCLLVIAGIAVLGVTETMESEKPSAKIVPERLAGAAAGSTPSARPSVRPTPSGHARSNAPRPQHQRRKRHKRKRNR